MWRSSEFESAGISYWASPIEARLCAGETVALIGGGNSAGQAVVFLAPQVAKLDLFVRRSLEATMSRYLIDRIAALPNVEIHVGQEIAALEGDAAGLAAATFRDIGTGHEQRWSLRHLFIFIGADPNTAFVRGCVEVDAAGFIKTGMDFAGQALSCGRTALLLERAGRLSSQLATFARDRPSVLLRQWAKVRRPSRRSTSRSLTIRLNAKRDAMADRGGSDSAAPSRLRRMQHCKYRSPSRDQSVEHGAEPSAGSATDPC